MSIVQFQRLKFNPTFAVLQNFLILCIFFSLEARAGIRVAFNGLGYTVIDSGIEQLGSLLTVVKGSLVYRMRLAFLHSNSK